MKNRPLPRCNRRAFLRLAALTAGTPLALDPVSRLFAAPGRADAKVAIVACKTYGRAVRESLKQSFDLLGGIGSLVKDKTVTVKVNLTGTQFTPFLGRPAGDTYMTHFDTALALASLLAGHGARRIRFVESTNSRAKLESSLGFAEWDLPALQALGKVEFENTRNLGLGKQYAELKVPGGGYLFSSFQLNHAYADTDVFVSLCKLKQHVAAGVTLAMKNLFGATPNSLYGDQAGSEDATGGRNPLHSPFGQRRIQLPGFKPEVKSVEQEYRVPHIVADLNAARPVHLAIIDGITSMSGGEGWWCQHGESCKVTTPGLLIVGLNAVSTDAVGTAVMGYANPRAPRGEGAFTFCENHLLLAEKAGVGVADLAQIEVLGLPLAQARSPYPELRIARRGGRGVGPKP